MDVRIAKRVKDTCGSSTCFTFTENEKLMLHIFFSLNYLTVLL